MYEELFASFAAVLIYADQQKDKPFMEGFRKYLLGKHPSLDLFGRSDVEFVDSKSWVGVQAADFIGGSISKCFDKDTPRENVASLVGILTKRSPSVTVWPPSAKTPFLVERHSGDQSEFDQTVNERAVQSAADFLNRNSMNKSGSMSDQIKCLRYLFYIAHFFTPSRQVSTGELQRYLNSNRPEPLTRRQLRSIVAALRDANVLISSSEKGYKIPVNSGDVIAYLKVANSIVRPMLDRVQNCCERIRIATHGQLDLLARPEYKNMKAAIEAFSPLQNVLDAATNRQPVE